MKAYFRVEIMAELQQENKLYWAHINAHAGILFLIFQNLFLKILLYCSYCLKIDCVWNIIYLIVVNNLNAMFRTITFCFEYANFCPWRLVIIYLYDNSLWAHKNNHHVFHQNRIYLKSCEIYSLSNGMPPTTLLHGQNHDKIIVQSITIPKEQKKQKWTTEWTATSSTFEFKL